MKARSLRGGLLALAAVAALTPIAPLAQPMDPVATRATAHVDAIKFTNPLGRSRGPGAGAGLL